MIISEIIKYPQKLPFSCPVSSPPLLAYYQQDLVASFVHQFPYQPLHPYFPGHKERFFLWYGQVSCMDKQINGIQCLIQGSAMPLNNGIIKGDLQHGNLKWNPHQLINVTRLLPMPHDEIPHQLINVKQKGSLQQHYRTLK